MCSYGEARELGAKVVLNNETIQVLKLKSMTPSQYYYLPSSLLIAQNPLQSNSKLDRTNLIPRRLSTVHHRAL